MRRGLLRERYRVRSRRKGVRCVVERVVRREDASKGREVGWEVGGKV